MSQTRAVGLSSAGTSVLVALIAAVYGCTQPPVPASVTLPECPQSGMWSPFFVSLYSPGRPTALSPQTPGLSIGMPGQLSLPGLQTDVPEFNDCQKFVAVENGTARFIALFAIFARAHLDSVTLDTLTNHGVTTQFPMGEIYAFDSAYAPLGIQPAFNCLYLYKDANNALAATMVPVGMDEQKCLTPQPATSGKRLAVTPVTMIGGTSGDYPPVARWDWNAKGSVQYIGIQCGAAWCEIHDPTIPFEPSKSYSLGASLPNATRRVVEVKGWYDEQRLALPNGSNPLVAGFTATFVPDPHLGDDHGTPDTSRYNGQWVTVATASVNGGPNIYATKLNLTSPTPSFLAATFHGPPGPVSTVYLCYSGTVVPNPCFPSGPPPSCSGGVAGTWWSMIQSNGGAKKYYCVIRREHPGVVIPGIVRWRWTVNDDTLWIRCLDGCCEVEAT